MDVLNNLIIKSKSKKLSPKDAEKLFREYYSQYSLSINRYCKMMINDKVFAEDIFQETFVAFYNHLCKGTEMENCKAFLFGIARNIIRNYHRDKKVFSELEITMVTEDDYMKVEKNELMELIMKSLDIIDDKQKEAYILREFDGLAFAEIAELTNTSISNAKSRVYRAHKELLKILKPYIKELEQM